MTRNVGANDRLRLAMKRAEKMVEQYEVALSNQKEIINRQKDRILELEARLKVAEEANEELAANLRAAEVLQGPDF